MSHNIQEQCGFREHSWKVGIGRTFRTVSQWSLTGVIHQTSAWICWCIVLQAAKFRFASLKYWIADRNKICSWLVSCLSLISEEEGTDLCCVISSLVQIMLDPHYRTLPGFQSLVQKEWVAGCHAFLDRCNHLYLKDKEVVVSHSLLSFFSSQSSSRVVNTLALHWTVLDQLQALQF